MNKERKREKEKELYSSDDQSEERKRESDRRIHLQIEKYQSTILMALLLSKNNFLSSRSSNEYDDELLGMKMNFLSRSHAYVLIKLSNKKN